MADEALAVRILLANGDGCTSEVATFPVSPRAVVHKGGTAGLPHAFVEVDHVEMDERTRTALNELADALPKPTGHNTMFDGGTADANHESPSKYRAAKRLSCSSSIFPSTSGCSPLRRSRLRGRASSSC